MRNVFKLILLCAFFAFLSNFSKAGWNQVSIRYDEDLNGVFFKEFSSIGWVVGDIGYVLRTTNSGVYWKSVARINHELYKIQFINDEIGFAVGGNGEIYRSVNRGYSWVYVNSRTSENLYNLFFTSIDDGVYIGANGIAGHTTNSGGIWNLVNTGVTTDLYGIDFVDENIGYACGDDGVILKTTNKGQSWSQLSSGSSDDFRAVCFTGMNTGYVVGEYGLIMKTTDAGSSWTTLTSGTTEDILGIDFTSNTNLGYAVGTNGLILKTTDAGSSWNIQTSPTENTLNDVCFTHQDKGYAVGNMGTLLYTHDGGGGWIENITVQSPNGGEHFIIGTQHNIQWETNLEGNVDIQYSTELGAPDSWIDIDNLPAGIGSYTWTIPDASSNNCLVRIKKDDDENIYDVSDAAFTISDYQIDLVYPSDGEEVPGGETYDITWTTDLAGEIYIFFSSDGGNNWEELATVDAQDLIYTWNVPEVNYDQCIIKLQSVNNLDVYSQNSEPFSIFWKPLQVVYPDGGQHWQVGEQHNIIWGGLHEGNIDIYYSVDAGNTWEMINSNVPVLSTQSWTVPNEPSSECLIKVVDVDDPTIFDISESFFTIGDIHFLTPDTGEDIMPLSFYDVSWNAQEVDNVTIEYSTDNGFTWHNPPIVEDHPATPGLYSWSVPNIESEFVLHIFDSDYPNIDDLRYFQVSNRDLELTYPQGGEYWKVGEEVTIEWESAHVDNVKLTYSTDHISWNTITGSVDADDNEYDWTVPAGLFPKTSGKKDVPMAQQDLWIKIESVELPKIEDETATNLIVTDSEITVLTPNGGEIWFPTTTEVITFQTQNVTEVDIDYSTDGGDTWLTIVENHPVNPDGSGEYTWNDLPKTLTNTRNTPSSRCLVRVSDVDYPNDVVNDVSDDFFSIAGVRVTTPDTYVKWLVGGQYNITWKYTQVNDIKIKYSIDNGLNWIEIEDNFPAESDYFTWTVPNTPSEQCLVKIVDTERSTLEDQSSENFTITGILLTYPQGGETFLSGTNENITWESADIENVKLEYSTDNGNSWVTIIANMPASAGSYNWLVPQVNSARCLVKVSSVDDPEYNDVNDPSFVILGEGIVVTSPAEGDVWNVGDLHQITWVSSNVNNVDVEYSFDNQRSWQTIANDVDASLGALAWNVPDNPSTECYVRVTDSENSNVFDVSDQFNIKGTVYPPPTKWNFRRHTGNNAIIVVPQALNPKIVGRKVKFGDALGVFFERDGEYVCAGFGFWMFEGDSLLQNLIITVWGDDEVTSIKDGFDVNEKYRLYAWDATKGVQYRVWTSFVNDNDYYYHDNISILDYFQVVDYQDIHLPAPAWTMISTYLDIVDDDIDIVCRDIEPNMYIFKDDEARVYIPEEDVNTLNKWDYDKGYMVNMRSEDTLRVWGYYKDPSDYPITLESMKWYIIPYLLRTEETIATALNSLAGNILVLKNNDGEVYYPDYGVDQIGNMIPGRGYKIICDTTDQLVYDAGGWFAKIEDRRKENRNKQNQMMGISNDPVYFKRDFAPTGNNSTLIVETEGLNDGDEIAVLNSGKEVIGSGVVNYGKACITVWGDSRYTEETEGAYDGEQLAYAYWENGSSEHYKLILSDIKDVLTDESLALIEYYEDRIWISKISEDNILSTEDASETGNLTIKAAPLPASDQAIISYFLPETGEVSIDLFDSIGNHKISLLKKNNTAGAYTLKIDLKNYQSGIYLMRITSNGVHAFNKLIIIK